MASIKAASQQERYDPFIDPAVLGKVRILSLSSLAVVGHRGWLEIEVSKLAPQRSWVLRVIGFHQIMLLFRNAYDIHQPGQTGERSSHPCVYTYERTNLLWLSFLCPPISCICRVQSDHWLKVCVEFRNISKSLRGRNTNIQTRE